MGVVLDFKKKKIAFVGEMIHINGDVLHTPFLYKVTDQNTGEEICPSLFTIDNLEDLCTGNQKINRAIGEIYKWCENHFSAHIEYDTDGYKLYAVSLENNQILYSIILMNDTWIPGDFFLDNSVPQYLDEKRGYPVETTDLRGNTVCIMGEVLSSDGEVYHTPVVTKITNIQTGRVQFPGIFRRRTLSSFFEYDDFQAVISCLFHCLTCEAEEMGADTWLTRDEDNRYQNIRLLFIDRETTRVLYSINAIQSTVDGNIIIPEDWQAYDTCPRYVSVEMRENIELNVEIEPEYE